MLPSPSPSKDSSSAFPPREASTLPPELVSRILKLATPPEQLYTDRLQILTSASLIARSWRDVAQRELFRSVAVEGHEIEALSSALSKADGGKVLTSWIVELSVSGRPAEKVSARSLGRLTSRCLNVRKLQLKWIDELCLVDHAVCKSRLETLLVEHSSFRVPYHGDGEIYATIRHVGLHACNIIGLASPEVDLPLGQFPSVRALALSAAENSTPETLAPLFKGRARLTAPAGRNVSLSTERCPRILSSFEPSLRTLSLDPLHFRLGTGFFNTTAISSIQALDFAPLTGFEGLVASPWDVIPGFGISSPTVLRLPAEESLIQSLRIVLEDRSFNKPLLPNLLPNLKTISLLPLGPPYDFSVYTSTEGKALEAACIERGVEVIYENELSRVSPFSEDGFWRFVRRVEEGWLAETEGGEEELVEGIGRLAV